MTKGAFEGVFSGAFDDVADDEEGFPFAVTLSGFADMEETTTRVEVWLRDRDWFSVFRRNGRGNSGISGVALSTDTSRQTQRIVRYSTTQTKGKDPQL